MAELVSIKFVGTHWATVKRFYVPDSNQLLEATQTIRPASIVMRRWQRSAIARSCVTSTSVVPSSWFSSNISFMMVPPVAKSRLT